MAQQKLSLQSALLININIILGAGVFINTVELAKRADGLSAFSYLFIGIVLLPLVASMASLLHIYPDGGFYSFATPVLGPFAGFFSTWSYFVGKLASATLMIHVAMLLICEFIPALKNVPLLILDGITICIFMLLNMCNMQTGSKIQVGFLIGKLTPLLFVILVGVIMFDSQTLFIDATALTGFASTIPLVLYATIGLEATCSLSRHISNSRRNAPIALFASYTIVILLLFLYQFCFYGTLGFTLSSLGSYLQAFPALITRIAPNSTLFITKLSNFMYLAIASSALGGAYAIIYSNMWNLYTLAAHEHLFASRKIMKTNREGIPFLCVLFQGLIIALYLFVTRGDQIPLQQTSALAVTISYAISIFSLLLLQVRNATPSNWIIPTLALGSAGLLIQACIKNFLMSGLEPLTFFFGMLLMGSTMFFVCNNKKRSE